MQLNTKQIELLQLIQSQLKYGDINRIAEKLGISRSTVGKTLNTVSGVYNEAVVEAAVEIIRNREAQASSLIASLCI